MSGGDYSGGATPSTEAVVITSSSGGGGGYRVQSRINIICSAVQYTQRRRVHSRNPMPLLVDRAQLASSQHCIELPTAAHSLRPSQCIFQDFELGGGVNQYLLDNFY